MNDEMTSQSAAADSWSVDLHLRHNSTDELAAIRSILLDSPAVRAVGEGGTVRFAMLRIQTGHGVSKYDVALRDVVNFLHLHASHLHAFTSGGGDVDLVLNHTTISPENSSDKTFDLWLAPELLKQLSLTGIGLRIVGWAEVETNPR